jgi:sulfur relay (sulfurtransferase) DsrF/TusC family protein
MEHSLCILIRRPPYGQIHAAEAIRHAAGALNEGIETNIILIDDGVYVARDGQNVGDTEWTPLAPALLKPLAKGARVFVHSPSSQARGLLEGEHFVVGVEMMDDALCAQLLAQANAVMVY